MSNMRLPRHYDTPSNGPAGSSNKPAATGAVRSIASEALMAGQRMILIRHGNDEYRLQITGAGKLILTK